MELKRKLLDMVRDKIRVKHYSIKTEKSYVGWIKHYIFYHNKKHPIEMAKPEIEAFLTHLAVESYYTENILIPSLSTPQKYLTMLPYTSLSPKRYQTLW